MSACEMCGRPNLDTAFACHPCAQATARTLHNQADNFDEITITVARLARFGETVRHTTREHPLPYNEDASREAATITNTLTIWAHHIQTQRGLTAPTPSRKLITWLAGQSDWLRYRQEGPQALDELAYTARLIEWCIDSPAQHWFAGRCEHDGCQGELYPRSGADTVTCKTCWHTHSVPALRDSLLRRADDTLGTATEIARFVSTMRGELITSAQVRGLAHRGRIIAHGKDRLQRPTYRVGDVLAALR